MPRLDRCVALSFFLNYFLADLLLLLLYTINLLTADLSSGEEPPHKNKVGLGMWLVNRFLAVSLVSSSYIAVRYAQ